MNYIGHNKTPSRFIWEGVFIFDDHELIMSSERVAAWAKCAEAFFPFEADVGNRRWVGGIESHSNQSGGEF